jgi:energy-converting hydrogenase Eha subunit A
MQIKFILLALFSAFSISIIIYTIINATRIKTESPHSNKIMDSALPPAPPANAGSKVPICNRLNGGFSIYSNNITVCNKDSSGASRQASEVSNY